MPFLRIDRAEPHEVVLRQLDPRWFRLEEGFRYVSPDGRDEVVVCPEPRTDLTSVPALLRWFVGRTGRHTHPVLLHDHDWAAARRASSPASANARRELGDRRFLRTLGEEGVPLVRRLVMWSAVVMLTRFQAGGARRVGILLWAAASATGTATLGWALLRRRVKLAAVAALAPVPFAVLWGREWRAGLAAGYGVGVVGLPTVAVSVGYGLYWLTEEGVRLVGRLAPAGRDLPGPTPPVEW